MAFGLIPATTDSPVELQQGSSIQVDALLNYGKYP